MSGRERGTALLLVLWVTVLLGALLIGVAATARSQAEAALYGSEHVRAELAARAGLAHAVAGLRLPGARRRWVPDGRPYHFAFDGAQVIVSVVDVNGLVDLNAAPPKLLRGLLEAAGVAPANAAGLALAIATRRSGGPSSSQHDPATTRAGAKPKPFLSIDGLLTLNGMGTARFGRIEHSVTVFSGRNYPDASYADAPVLAALRGISVDAAQTLVKGRRARPAQSGARNKRARGAIADGALVAGYGGTVERVFTSAVMPDGTRADLDVTIRLALTGVGARPYKVLQWRADSPGRAVKGYQ